MFSTTKAFWVIVGLYVLTIFLPAAISASLPNPIYVHQVFPPEQVRTTLIACALFLGGLGLGALLFRFDPPLEDGVATDSFRAGLTALIGITVLIAAYVFGVGPPSPFLASFRLTDANAIAMARENAFKLNPDVIFVRLYAWGRDLVGPATFVLCIRSLRLDRARTARVTAVIGLVAATYVGLWSGHKATMVNYLLAAFVFGAPGARAMMLRAAKATPLLLGLVAVLFWLTLPELVGNPHALGILFTAVSNRLLFGPLEVAIGYVDALDRLRIIQHADALPYLSFLWSPDMLTVENHVGIQYFTLNPESTIHANGAAFAYAYVLAGYLGCFVGGFLVMAGLNLAMRVVRATGSQFLLAAFGACISYTLLDLLNGNFVSYLLKIVVLAVLVWGFHGVIPRPGARLQPSTSPT